MALLTPLHLFSGARRGGGGSRKSFEKPLLLILAMTFIGLGTFMYFSIAAGNKIVDFVDVKVQIGSIVVSPGPLYGHELIATGANFNGVTVTGKVRANRDVPPGYWVAARVIVTGYYKERDECGRYVWTTDPIYFPGPNYYYIQGSTYIGELKAGETKEFSFSINKDTILSGITETSYYKSMNPDAIGGFHGRVDLAIIFLENAPQLDKTTTIYKVVRPDYKAVEREDAFTWDFNVQFSRTYQSIVDGGFCKICTIPNGFTISRQSLMDIHGQGIIIETKMSLTAAVLLFPLPLLFILYKAFFYTRSRKSGGFLKILLITIVIIILLIILGRG
ncbi:MAG: hypothetical protein QW721_01955 [Desulfurococcaceae archaeon]